MGIVLGMLLWLGKALFWISLMFVAACAGLLLGAIFGVFMGPIKIIEWTSNGIEDTSSDSI